VSYCATCDAPLYRGKTAAVVGYSPREEAEAAFLSEVCAQVLYFPMYPGETRLPSAVRVIREKVTGIEADCAARKARKDSGAPMRFLLTIGGAGAQKEIFAAIIRDLLPKIREGRAALYVNVGDYRNVWDALLSEIPEMKKNSRGVRGMKLGPSDFVAEIHLLSEETSTEYRGRPVALNRLKLAHRDGKGSKLKK
jgi:hypothetical protein